MVASRPAVATRRARTTSTALRSTTSSALTPPDLRRNSIRVSSPTYKNIVFERASRLTFSLNIFSPVWTMYQMATMRQSMRGGWNGRRAIADRTRKPRRKSCNESSSVSDSALATSIGDGSSHSVTTTRSGSAAGSRAVKYGTAETAGVVARGKSGTAEIAISAHMGGPFPAADAEASQIRITKTTKATKATKNTKDDRPQAVLVKALKKAATKLKKRSSQIFGVGDKSARMPSTAAPR